MPHASLFAAPICSGSDYHLSALLVALYVLNNSGLIALEPMVNVARALFPIAAAGVIPSAQLAIL